MAEYLYNTWYAAAFSSEVENGGILARVILEENIAIFRTEKGEIAAVADRCPHRFARLHTGSVKGEALQCPYHGLQFSTSGQCVHNPYGDGAIAPNAKVRSFPLEERYGVIWIWMGEEAAEPERIPDFDIMATDKSNSVTHLYMNWDAQYELVTDNLMDPSHVDYIHGDLLNTGGLLTKISPKVRVVDGHVHAHWEYTADQVQLFFQTSLPDPEGRATQTFDTTWYPPANLLIQGSAYNVGEPVETALRYHSIQLITPEKEASCHYFFLGRRTFDVDNAAFSEAMRVGILEVFQNEDKPAVEGAQAAMKNADFWSLNPVILPCDLGAVHARRALRRLIKAEQEKRNGSSAAA